MTIGEPKHAMPAFVGEVLAANLSGFNRYPQNDGIPPLLDAIAAWLKRRYGVDVAPNRLITANGTREALFNAAVALSPETKNGARPVILALTANAFESDRTACLAAGMDGFLTKPVRRADLIEAMTRHFAGLAAQSTG